MLITLYIQYCIRCLYSYLLSSSFTNFTEENEERKSHFLNQFSRLILATGTENHNFVSYVFLICCSFAGPNVFATWKCISIFTFLLCFDEIFKIFQTHF